MEPNDPISSLNEAWCHTLDSCVVDFPLSEVILPLTRNCFFAGATYAVLLLQRGHGDQLVRDIAGFGDEAVPSVPPRALQLARGERPAEPLSKRNVGVIRSHCRNSVSQSTDWSGGAETKRDKEEL
jgi:hypothetical protein